MTKRAAHSKDDRYQLVHCADFTAIALRVMKDARGENWRQAKKMNLNGIAETLSIAVFNDRKARRAVKKLLGSLNIRTWKDLRNALNEKLPKKVAPTYLQVCYSGLKKPPMAYQSAIDNEQAGRGLGELPLIERNKVKRELIAFKKTGGW